MLKRTMTTARARLPTEVASSLFDHILEHGLHTFDEGYAFRVSLDPFPYLPYRRRCF